LAKQFQRRRFLEIDQPETRIAYTTDNRVNIYQTGDFDVHSSTTDNRVNIYQTGDFDADLKYKMVDTI
jgi:hypothetical protein